MVAEVLRSGRKLGAGWTESYICLLYTSRSKEKIYQAAMLEPHTAAELNIDDIKAMCDELIEAHGDYMSMYKMCIRDRHNGECKKQ